MRRWIEGPGRWIEGRDGPMERIDSLLHVTLAGAFLGGVLALLSPCSALLLPAFFAYAFKSKTQLAARTAVFLLGLSTLFVPLGMGAAFAGRLILDWRDEAIWIVGSLLILFGVLEWLGLSFSLLPSRLGSRQIDESWTSAYVTGLVYGFAGFCSGPLLGAVLTMAAGAAHPLHGGLLLFIYGTGMALPLFVLALLWDKYDLGSRRWLRGRAVRLGPWRMHSTRLITGGLFIGLGALFMLSGGSLAFERFYERIGLLHVSMRWQQALNRVGQAVPDWAWIAFVLIAVGVWYVGRGKRERRNR